MRKKKEKKRKKKQNPKKQSYEKYMFILSFCLYFVYTLTSDDILYWLILACQILRY